MNRIPKLSGATRVNQLRPIFSQSVKKKWMMSPNLT